eukprot:g14997.t1
MQKHVQQNWNAWSSACRRRSRASPKWSKTEAVEADADMAEQVEAVTDMETSAAAAAEQPEATLAYVLSMFCPSNCHVGRGCLTDEGDTEV